MRLARALLTVPLVVAVVEGCSLLVDTDGLAGGVEADAGGDLDSAVGDDGGSSTDGRAGDAGSDAAPCTTEPGAFPFCDDFERDAPIGAWTRLSVGDGGAVAIGQDSDGNRFLRITSRNDAVARLTLERGRVFREAEASFDLRFRSVPSGGSAIGLANTAAPQQRFGAIYALVGGARYVVHHAFLPDADTQAGYGQTPLKLAVDVGRWQRWALRLDFDAVPPTVELRIDGLLAASGSMHPSFTPAPVTFFAGTPFGDELEFDIDNVRFDGR